MIGSSIVGSWAFEVLMTCFSLAMLCGIRAKFELINAIGDGLHLGHMLLVIR